MRTCWILLLAVCLWSSAQGTYRVSERCECNRKALYCVRDHMGLRCENCQDNTEGRHCEHCKEGFYHQRARERCQPCSCNPAGSAGQGCDSQGQCVCKVGVQGSRCDRCADGTPVTAQGCEPQRQSTCFCNGHSSECSQAAGYAVHSVSSAFDQGVEGWRPVTAQTVNPSQVTFKWSPAHRHIEVISKDFMPVYLSAPAQYLGNQVLSYGQTLSFTLRLDRGVRYPSGSDVVLEGAGLKVSAPLGDLRTVIPCGKKITYTFRLDEQPGSKWKPQLSSTDFQTLLSDLTAVKIRATFGENGYGYLDDVTLVSARQGSGTPAGWVRKCRCPAGYEGVNCEHCAAGYKRRFPGQGRRSPCEPCNCRGGGCDPETGDCYSADEMPNGRPCPTGFYENPRAPGTCLRCPCPPGNACLVTPGTLDVICNCPPGTSGSRCQRCDNGFYGDPQGERGVLRPCRPCQCNGHLDPNSLYSCDDVTGECLRCLNNTSGWSCEKCLDGFYHSKPTDACQACNCDPEGAVSRSCSYQGQCRCREGFGGLRCERSACPSCFTPVQSQVEKYTQKLLDLEVLVNSGGGETLDSSALKKRLSTAEETVDSLQKRGDTLSGTELLLYNKLLALSQTQSEQERRLQDVSRTVNVSAQAQWSARDVADIQKLIRDIRQNLRNATDFLQQIEIPLRDAAGDAGNNTLTSLVHKATELAQQHLKEAGSAEDAANQALSETMNASALLNPIISGEQHNAQQILLLQNQLSNVSTLVDDLERQAPRLMEAAKAESEAALNALKLISDLEKNLTVAPQGDTDVLVARLDGLKDSIQSNVTDFQELRKKVGADRNETALLLDQLRTAQQAENETLTRANAAKTKAEQAMKLFSSLDGVNHTLDKLRGFTGKINISKASADEALSKLPLINSTIQQAVSSNALTQSVLADQRDYTDALDNLDKLDTTLTRTEKLSTSLPSSSDLLRNANVLERDTKDLLAQADLIRNKLPAEIKDVKATRSLAEEVNRDANQVYQGARITRNSVADTLAKVNNLLSSLGNPGAVDDKRVAELERAVKDSRSFVESDLRPRLTQLEDKEALHRAAVERMVNDISTILLDIQNLRDMEKSIPTVCLNTGAHERP